MSVLSTSERGAFSAGSQHWSIEAGFGVEPRLSSVPAPERDEAVRSIIADVVATLLRARCSSAERRSTRPSASRRSCSGLATNAYPRWSWPCARRRTCGGPSGWSRWRLEGRARRRQSDDASLAPASDRRGSVHPGSMNVPPDGHDGSPTQWRVEVDGSHEQLGAYHCHAFDSHVTHFGSGSQRAPTVQAAPSS